MIHVLSQENLRMPLQTLCIDLRILIELGGMNSQEDPAF
jgi:hypothetical protein